ncbi:MFS transporter [Vibrio crassostreae]|nr:conserved membrane hypothetical protein [Vibrio chagasii]CAK1804968.1 MFS transporter [Vibrio crassostreae]CAK1814824.1 MFS transporter [Vibrio crassostreae]CAK2678423.1 MFS transporter [Vibrio crassostreae]CAK2683351.1 MFS transporter [Vibrio crassostreae]
MKAIRLKLLGNISRNFFLFCIASFVSSIGNSIIPIAFAIESVKISPSGVGISIVLISLWLGRYLGTLQYRRTSFVNLKRVILVSDFFKLSTQLGLLLYIYVYSNDIVAMAVSSFIYGIASSFFAPSSYRLIPVITLEKERERCNSILSAMGDVFGILGPLVGATIVIFLGFELVLLVDVITFGFALLMFSLMDLEKQVNSVGESETPKPDANSKKMSMIPVWSENGIRSWFFASVCIGFMGSAGPFLIIQNHSEYSWALVATIVSVGSLLGSASVMTGKLTNIKWKGVHFLCLLFLTIQLLAFNSQMNIYIIAMFGLIGALFTTMSGVKWDTKVQSELSPNQLSIFAAKEQLWMNTAIPMGMLLFAFASLVELIDLTLIVISVTTFLSTIFLIRRE